MKQMQSLRELYRIGYGPSSSHTIGVSRAAKIIQDRYSEADRYAVTLFGSLASTGKGHGTDNALLNTLSPAPVKIVFDTETETLRHPNTLDITAFSGGTVLGGGRFYSTGGGAVEVEGEENTVKGVYNLSTFAAIKKYCQNREMRLCDFVYESEGNEIKEYLALVWTHMKSAIRNGLSASGKLPGPLKVDRKAGFLFSQKTKDESPQTREHRMVCSFAFAVAEENAGGGEIVTAPTCGACGVMPAALYSAKRRGGFSDAAIIDALATGGIIGNLIKTNASISGAECGCQAEIGSACSMTAAALAELYGMSIDKIEYAAEIAMEHHLGLTCDPIAGLVQIPCIERNAVAAMRAINAVSLASFLSGTRKISFDLIIETMYETGKDLSALYKETSKGGLAKLYKIE